MVVLASAGGNTVPAIARLVQADEDSAETLGLPFTRWSLRNSPTISRTTRRWRVDATGRLL